MPINIVIREKRKQLGMTQEQVAEYLGVSAPAVNKWEKGVSYPDICLISSLARLLKVDLNTLLCFHEELSEQEIYSFCHEITKIIEKDGFKCGFDMAFDKLHEYPNCYALIHSIALILNGALLMLGSDYTDKEFYKEQIIALYDRAAKSGDERIRNGAVFLLVSDYLGRKEFDKAQEMLDLLPERTAWDKNQLQANLYVQKNRLDEASEVLERKLLAGVNEVQMTLISLAEIETKKNNAENADQLSMISKNSAELFELWDYCSFIAPLQNAVAKKDVEKCIANIRSLLSSSQIQWDSKKTFLYQHF